MTEVNHDPGPSTTQSASSTASTDSGQAGGSSGSGGPSRPRPSSWRRAPGRGRRRPRRGGRARAPMTSASMSSGTEAIGSTRPVQPSSRATMSRPATGSPRRSHRPAMSRLPIAWSPSGPGETKRYCRTSAHVRPDSSSPQSAARAIRRSPGGRQPSSSRSRPDEPPSSATVTTAVSRSVTRRRAESDADRPCPPPNATTAGRTSTIGRPCSADGRPRLAGGPHSRPRSRCRTVVGSPSARSRRASSSDIAVLRCLPPVHPMPMVAKRLPSCR